MPELGRADPLGEGITWGTDPHPLKIGIATLSTLGPWDRGAVTKTRLERGV